MLDERAEHSARDRFLMLRGFPGLDRADDESVAYLASQARIRRFEQGAVVSEGDGPARGAWIVRRGALAIERGEHLRSVVRRPRGTGFLEVVSDDPRGVRVTAVEPTVALELGAATVLRGLEENFSLLRNTLANLADGLLEVRGNLPADPKAPPPTELGTFRRRPLTLVERVLEARASSAIFGALDVAACLELAGRQRDIRYAPGTRLWSVGDPPGDSLRIVAGHIRCSEAGGQSVLVGPEFRLGGLDLMAGHPRVYDAVTETEVEADVMDGLAFFTSLELHRRAAMLLVAALARQIIGEEDRRAARGETIG
ncbi:MAG: hypothetical protein ACFCGT_28435 [Sandaracinaceae bacterium]